MTGTPRWRRVITHAPMMVGAVIVLAVVVMALAAPVLAPADPTAIDLPMRLRPPGEDGRLLGTDGFGRDVWSRLVFGTRVSLQVGVVAVSIGAVAGLVVGLAAGYFGGWVDMLTGRVLDVVMAFPTILLALAVVAALGPSLTHSMIAIGLTSIPRFARVTRGAVLAVRGRDFVQAAEALGAPTSRILAVHVLPNVLSPLVVMVSLGVGSAILVEASLSFLGLGVAPPTPTWGSMITDGKHYIDLAPWISGFAGLFIMVTVLGFNLLGDGLRDLSDPKLRAR
ncbi:MAG: ABC transporter permease [bacterium]|nr:ABC transporter permease [bacterium]